MSRGRGRFGGLGLEGQRSGTPGPDGERGDPGRVHFVSGPTGSVLRSVRPERRACVLEAAWLWPAHSTLNGSLRVGPGPGD